jgi:small subunit ribosomal protein S16
LLVIRLSRTGRTKYPTYRIVAAESARSATGKFVAVLGHYNPHTKELVIQSEETARYLGNGAQPSNSVIKLLKQGGVDMPAWAKFKTKEPRKVEKVEEAPAAEVVPEAVAADEITPAEAETEAVVEAIIADDAATEAEEVVADEAPQDEARVGEVAEATASDDADDAAAPIDHTDTAADADKAEGDAEASEAAAVEAATDEPAAE